MEKENVLIANTFETEWVRSFASTYLPCEAGFRFSPDDLKSAGVTLIAVKHAMKFGSVVYSDKLDEPGAYWIVEGQDINGNILRLELIVVSEILSVTLTNVEMVIEANMEKEPYDDDNAA